VNPLIQALIQQVLLPEIMTAIRAHKNATGKLPTDAEVLDALTSDAENGIAVGDAWLASHPSTT